MRPTDITQDVRNTFVRMRQVIEWLDQKDLSHISAQANPNLREVLNEARALEGDQLQRLVTPERHAAKVLGVLTRARDELRRLRRSNELMGAQLRVLDIIDRATRGVTGPSEGMSIDVAWEIDSLIGEVARATHE